MLEPIDSEGERPIKAVSRRPTPSRANGRPLADDVTVGAAAAAPIDGRSPSTLGSTSLSHELRTPLNAILGNAELLLDGSAGPLSHQARACLGEIQTAGQRMLRRVQFLLDLCRARSRPALGVDDALDLIELLRRAQAAAPRIESGQAVQVMPADARCILRGDRHWLGVLALALVELPLSDGRAGTPLLVTVEPCAPAGGAAALRFWWGDFHPDQVAALPVALIEAILDLHGGMVALTGGGLQLDWPAPRVVQVGPSAAGCACERNGV